MGLRYLFTLFSLSSLLYRTNAAVTVYTTTSAIAPQVTANFADQTVLTPPGAPAGLTAVVDVQLDPAGMAGLSLPVAGNFLGFSIELSIATGLLGENGGNLHPEFLNYCGVLVQRGGGIVIRLGGNTQDTAVLAVNGNENGKTLEKFKASYQSTTDTPDVHFTMDLIHIMKQISSLINADWIFGVPFVALDADGNAGLIVQQTMNILGPNLLALQLANEPDLYAENGKKGVDYSIDAFMSDTQTILGRLQIPQPLVVGPSVCCRWSIDQMLSDGYLTRFSSSLKYINIMHYPNDNCQRNTPNGQNPQDVFPQYLSHKRVQDVVSPYFEVAQQALAGGKQLIMLETNTASCSGFPGISNSFASALWGVDYGLQMAYGNFTHAFFHFGGLGAWYNPFTAPPGNTTKWYKFTTGAIFYSQIIVAETLGKSGNAQVVDLQLDNNNINRAGYAVYEQGVASRAVFINYVSNPGVSDYTVSLSVGASTPSSVRVKYLLADSVSEKYNITWAGQNMGGMFESDGRLYGDLDVQTVQCDTTARTCQIKVPSPSVALVFLTDEAYQNSGGDESATQTFATTTTTGKHATRMTIDPAALATTNGRNGKVPYGTTSHEIKSSAGSIMVSATLLVSAFAGAMVLLV